MQPFVFYDERTSKTAVRVVNRRSLIAYGKMMSLTLNVAQDPQGGLGSGFNKIFGTSGGSIGRDPMCDFVLPDHNLYISGKHAVIHYQDQQYYITDTSTNGLFLNRDTAPVGKGSRVRLHDGDHLMLGDYEFTVAIQRVNEEQSAPNASGFTEFITPTANKSNHLDPLDNLGEQVHTPDNRADPLDPLDLFKAAKNVDPFITPETQIPQDAQSQDPEQLMDPLALLVNKSDAIINPEPESELVAGVLSQEDHSNGDGAYFKPPVATSEIPDDWNELTSLSHLADIRGASTEVPPPSAPKPTSPPMPEHTILGIDEIPAVTPVSTSTFKKPKPVVPVHNTQLGAISADQQTTFPITDEHPQQPAATPPETPQSKKVATAARTQQPANASVSNSDCLNAFFQGAGIPPQAMPQQDPAQTMDTLGQIFHVVIKHTLEILAARAHLKSEFRLMQTMIRPEQNNPLKFSVGVEDAMKNLLSQQNTRFMPPVAAIEEAFRNIQEHQIGVVAGMQSIFHELLEKFDPIKLEQDFAKDHKRGLLGFSKRIDFWELYSERYKNIVNEADDNFQTLYGDYFSQAYEEQISRMGEQPNAPTKSPVE